MGLRGVVFDFDLTLADSTVAVVECSNHALSAMGFKAMDSESVRRTIGLTLPQAFRELSGSGDPTLAAEYSRRFVGRADEVMVASTRVYEGVPATLQTLRDRGLRLAVVSTKFRYRIEAILAQSALSNAFEVIVGGEDVTEHKPHPEGLLHALARLNVTASQAIYVGDHPFDAEAAVRAGTAFVAVRTGVQSAEAWSACAPLGVIDDVSGLPELLQATGHLEAAL